MAFREHDQKWIDAKIMILISYIWIMLTDLVLIYRNIISMYLVYMNLMIHIYRYKHMDNS